MGLIAFFLWRTLKQMPRPSRADQAGVAVSSIGWDDIAGVEEAKDELQRGRGVPARPQALPEARRHGAARASCSTARPAPARRCWPRPWRRSRAPSSSPSRPPRSSRCSPASARRASAACSPKREGRRRPIIFIDELDAVGGHRGADISGEKDQTLNQLLVEMDGFSAAGRRRGHRRLQPAREARPGAAAPGPLRSPDLRLAARRHAGARSILHGAHAQQAAAATSTSSWSRGRRAVSPAPTWPTSATRRRSSPPRRGSRARHAA